MRVVPSLLQDWSQSEGRVLLQNQHRLLSESPLTLPANNTVAATAVALILML